MQEKTANKKRKVSAPALAAAILAAGVAVAGSVPGVRSIPYTDFTNAGGEPKVKTITLDPTRGWSASDVFLDEGDLVTITAEGLVDPGVRISRGPDGQGRDQLKEMTHNCRYMELLGRIGDGPPFCVGSAGTFEVIEGGHLSFHVNELDSIRFDDRGYFDITIRHKDPGEEKPKDKQGLLLTAALDLVPINVTDGQAEAISSQVRASLAGTGRYIVMDAGAIEQKRRRLKIDKKELADPAKASELGKALGAQTVITGQVGKIGEGYSITLQRVNPYTGAVESTAAEVIECPPSQLPKRISAMVGKL